MNNIQKSFKKKSELRCMADGGVVDHMSGKSREQQLKEATGHSIPAKAPGPGQPDFRNVRSSSQTTYGQKPKSALQRLFGMADGGEAPDGEVKGPGGPTDDKVGPVMLSDGEYVLPADTVKAIGKDKLDTIRDATHKFVDSEPGGLANGTPSTSFFDDVAKRAKDGFSALRSAVAPTPAAPAAAPPPVAPAPAAPAAAPAGLSPATQNLADQAARRPVLPNGAPSSSLRPVNAPGDLPNYRTGNGFQQTPQPNMGARPGVPTGGGSSASVGTGAADAAKAAGGGGSALRGLGRLAGGVGGVYGLATGGADIAKNGANVTNVGDTVAGGAGITAALASGAAAPIAGAAATGWGVGRMIGGNLSADTNNAIGGTINEIGLMAKKRLGFGWGDENAYVPSSASGALGGPQSASGAPSATPVADATRGTGSPMAKEKPPSGPQYYADLERQHQQELAQMRGGNREAGARAAAGGGPGAGQYPGQVENRSGLPNSALAGADPNSYYASLKDDAIAGSFNGRNYTKKELDARGAGLATASGQAMKPEGDPAMAEIRSALRGIGNGGGGGNWAPRSNAREINERYDALMRGGSGRNIVKGSDWSQRHGLAVESARAKELGDDASNQSTLRGQNMQAGASADQTRMSGITKMMELQAERERANGTAQAAATKAQQDALKQAADANQQGYENFTKAAEQMFVGPEGKPDPAQQQQFMDFVSATDPKILEEGAGVRSVKDLFDLAPQEQMNAVQRLKTMMSMQAAANKSIGNATMLNNGPQQTGFDAPLGDAREGTWGDVASGKLSVGQWLYGNVPFTEKNVQPLTSGGVVPLGDYVGNNADAEKIRLENIRNKLKYNNQ